MNVRVLTLDEITDDLLTECGLRRGAAAAPNYRCIDSMAVLVPTADIIGPSRRKRGGILLRSSRGPVSRLNEW